MKHAPLNFIRTVLVLVISYPVYSQNYALDWAKSLTGDDQFEMANAAFDNSGNIIAVGRFNGTVDFDPGPGVSNLTSTTWNAFIIKLSPLGSLLWVKKYNVYSATLDMSIDLTGAVYLVGEFTNTVDFDPGPSVFNLTSSGGSDVFILKLSSSGGFVWAKQIGGIQSDYGESIITDNMGNLFLTGSFKQTVDFDPGPGISNYVHSQGSGFLIKLNPAGVYQWSKQIGDTLSVYPKKLFFDHDQNLIISGNFYQNTDFDPGIGANILTTGFLGSTFLLKLTYSGDFRWVKGYGDSGYDDDIQDVVSDSEGNLFITGYFNDSIDMDPGSNTYILATISVLRNMFASKIDSSGNFQWAFSVGLSRTEGFAIARDSAGDLYIGGNFFGTVDFDPGSAVFNLHHYPNGSAFLLKINTNGQFLWANSFGGDFSSLVNDIVIASNGDILLAGSYAAFLGGNFNPWFGTHFLYSANKNMSGYLVKSSYCQATTINTTIASCDSMVSPSGKYTWYTSGVYEDTLNASSGCDSIVVVNLTIHQTTNLMDTVKACKDYTWPFSGQKYYTSGTYTESYTTPAGCDSTAVLYLTINQPSSGSMTVNACNSYTWPANNMTYYASGGFNIIIPNHKGCDSLLSLFLTVTEIDDSVTLTNNSLIANQKHADSYQWLDCDNNFALIPQATTRVLQDTSGGFFAVVITKKNCVDTSACYSIKSLGIDEWTSQVKVYPNPTRGMVWIELPPDAKKKSMTLFSAHGELIRKYEKSPLDNKWAIELPGSGFYLLTLRIDNTQRVYKLLRY